MTNRSERPLPTLYVHFNIEGPFDAEGVTRALGIEPHTVWRKGETRGSQRRIVTQDQWDYRLGPVKTSDFGPLLDVVLDKFGVQSGYLRTLRASTNCVVTITLSAWVPDHPLSFVPIASLGFDQLLRITDLGGNLQFDINLVGPDEPELTVGDARHRT